MKSGLGGKDTAAVCAVLEKMAKVKRGKASKAQDAKRRLARSYRLSWPRLVPAISIL